jgi:hypothetical protein
MTRATGPFSEAAMDAKRWNAENLGQLMRGETMNSVVVARKP